MKKLLWIGSFLTEDKEKELNKKGYHNPASALSQRNILEGIENIYGSVFDSINSISLNGYPKEKIFCLKENYYSHTNGASDILTGFINIKYLNKFFSTRSLLNKVKKWIKKNNPERLEVYIYEMRSNSLKAAKLIKKYLPDANINLIVPDLPQFMDLKMGKLKTILKKIDWKSIKRNLKYIDNFIFYSAKMAEFLKLDSQKWMVMEGSINIKDIEVDGKIENNIDCEKNIVMYSGSLSLGFGIENLLDSMNFLDNSFELWISGGGAGKSLIEERAKQDGRIKYFGYFPTRKELKAKQNAATMLINMRLPEETASSYCFPSKLFEYMLSGKPVLSCQLNGIPKEYFKYLIEIKSSSPCDIAEAIKKVAKMSEEEKKNLGEKSRYYIINQKNNIIQAKNIIQFCNREKEN